MHVQHVKVPNQCESPTTSVLQFIYSALCKFNVRSLGMDGGIRFYLMLWLEAKKLKLCPGEC